MTLVNGELSTDAPFGSAAHKYLQAGWPVFTLPNKQKFPPPAGVTGWRGHDLKPEEVEDLQRAHGRMNIGVRMPTGAVGIDVDAYGGKEGGRTLSALEAELGPLPDAPILTSRDDGVSGIRVFRLPGDEVLQGVMGPGIEVIQRHHRYAVAAPSAHPKNKDPYRWLNPDRSEAPDIPRVTDLPPLPQPWVDRFRAVPRSPGGPAASSGMVQVWLSAHDTHVACPRIVRAVKEFVGDEGSRHDSMLKAQLAIANLGAMGHRGASDGLERLREAFIDAIGDDRNAEDEWYEALAGAIGIVHGDPPTHTGCCSTPTGKPPLLNVPNPAEAPDYFLQQLSENQALFGTFTFGDSFVWTPRLGETGYTPPKEGDDNGPAMIQPLDATGLTAFVNARVWLYDERIRYGRVIRVRTFGSGWKITTRRARHHDDIPVLRGVTHTPCLKPDGSVLDVPGYDPMSGLAYMPLTGLEVPPIPADPSPEELAAASQLLLGLVSEFPWVTGMDRNNFLAMWLSPLILPLLAEPGPLGLINAPMMGSGKTLLSKVLSATHGAVLRGQLPTESEEQRKQITSLLTQTTAPVVIWDNVAGTVRSEHLASLTTKPEWTDRILGATQEVSVPAKRLFVLNGNNISLGGDLARRGVWATIDPDMPKPWERTGYKYEHLDRYVASHRGEVLAALLTLVRAWAAAGFPQATVRSDSFSEWFGTMNGILTVAGVDGGVGNTEKDTSVNSEDDDDLQDFLEALWDVFGTEQFASGDAAGACVAGVGTRGGYSDLGRALPQDLHDKLADGGYRPVRISKSLGKYMARYEGRWTAQGFTIRQEKRRGNSSKNSWRVLRRDSSAVTPFPPLNPAGGAATTQVSEEKSSIKTSSCERGESNGGNGNGGRVFIDFETCSADRLWTTAPDPAYLRIMAYGNENGVTVTDDHDEMRRVLTEAGTLIGHNIYDFDLKAAARHLCLDFEKLLAKSIDTLVLARLKWPVEATKDRQPEHGHGLDELAQRFLGLAGKAALGTTPSGNPRTLAAYATMWNRKAKLDDKYAAIPTDDPAYRDYCAQDVALLPPLLQAVQADDEYAQRELEYLRSLARMSYRGLCLDRDVAAERVQEENDRVAVARDWFKSRGIEVKKKFSKEGKEAFGRTLEEAGFTVPRTDKGSYCSAVDALREAGIDHEALDYLSMLNRARGLPEASLQVVGDDGRVHPSVQASQASGRLSIKKPALTTFGADDRRNLTDRDLFIAADDHLLLAVDLNAIDVRGMAWHSQDPAMIERLQPGKDWHTEMAVVVYGDPSKRKVAKPLSHSINYSSGPANLAESAGVTYEVAVTLIQQLDETFSALAEFKANVGALAKSGSLVPNGWGRLMRPDTDSPGRAMTTGGGLSGQGWARDALAECQLRLEQKGLGQYIVLSIHDELVFELPECEAEVLRDEIVEVMTFDVDGVPVLCKPSRLAMRWSDCYRNEV